MRVKRDKCEFMRERIEYLGHRVVKNRVHALEDKLEAVRKMPLRPKFMEVRNAQFENIDTLPVTAKSIASETANDQILKKVKKVIEGGWPKKVESDQLKAFEPNKNCLELVNGCIMLGNRTVIPRKFHGKMLQLIACHSLSDCSNESVGSTENLVARNRQGHRNGTKKMQKFQSDAPEERKVPCIRGKRLTECGIKFTWVFVVLSWDTCG
ncbi:hypothetical protein niasHT_009694 [Heterodera trifolii]|uniref:Uncharacterized protein n=1 Tax=Heterodera trifolii TaxID=157864 RepID=A0ABD2MDN0_9BILA